MLLQARLLLSLLGLCSSVDARVILCSDNRAEVNRGLIAVQAMMPSAGAERVYLASAEAVAGRVCDQLHAEPAPWIHSWNFQTVSYVANSPGTVTLTMVDSSRPICLMLLDRAGQLQRSSVEELKLAGIEQIARMGAASGAWWAEESSKPGLDASLSGLTLVPRSRNLLRDVFYSCSPNQEIDISVFLAAPHIGVTMADEFTHAMLALSRRPFQHCTGNIDEPEGCEEVDRQMTRAKREAKLQEFTGIRTGGEAANNPNESERNFHGEEETLGSPVQGGRKDGDVGDLPGLFEPAAIRRRKKESDSDEEATGLDQVRFSDRWHRTGSFGLLRQ